MKVLIAHNYYQLTGGEDQVFLNEKALLESYGHEVIEYVRYNSEIMEGNIWDYALLPARTIWNWGSYEEVKKLLDHHKPDVAHFHNIFPLISTAAYSACWDAKVPVVQSLHNSRLICPSSNLYYKGRYCQDCMGKTLPWHGIARRCYHHSPLQTSVVGIMSSVHRARGTWRNLVARYIVFSTFFYEKFIEAGFPKEKFVIKPHFTADPGQRVLTQDYVLYAGRLTHEKGVTTLLNAWGEIPDVPLRICGNGPLMPQARDLESASQGNIKTSPFKPHNELIQMLKGAAFLVWPSEACETFGMIALEALACGVPVISSGVGAMSDLIADGETGLTFRAGDAKDMAAKVRWAWEHRDEMEKMGRNARDTYMSKYTADLNHKRLISIYQEAIEQRHADGMSGNGTLVQLSPRM